MISAARRPSLKFWNTKTHRQRVHAKDLVVENKALLAVLAYASWYAWERWQKKITITSIYRTDNDPKGMHQRWRAADLRIFSLERDGEGARSEELSRAEAIELANELNRAFAYGKTWFGRKTDVAIVRLDGTGSDTAPHMHIQTKRRSWR